MTHPSWGCKKVTVKMYLAFLWHLRHLCTPSSFHYGKVYKVVITGGMPDRKKVIAPPDNVITHPQQMNTYPCQNIHFGSVWISISQWKQLMGGMFLYGEHQKTLPMDIDIVSEDKMDGTVTLQITMQEGRNHQLRRMFDQVNHPVRSITRQKHGPIGMKGLRPGEWRKLSLTEVQKIKSRQAPKLPARQPTPSIVR